MPPPDIDLNLLRVFVQLHQDRKVSLAAEHLGLSQPAMSNALARLRRLLGDPLFVRTAHGMQPTALAEQLAGPVANALATIRDSLAQPLRFDAATSERAFTLAMTDIGEVHFLPLLMQKLRALAPGVALSTVRSTAVNLRFEMEHGKVDLALGHLPDLVTDFHQRPLFEQRYVCLMRRGHPLAAPGALDAAAFAGAEHAQVVAAGTGHGQADAFIARAGVRRRVRLRVPHFVALPDILETTDLIATVPEAFARRALSHYALVSQPHPLDLPPIAITLFWHAQAHRDPANRWLRELVARHFREG